MGMEFFKTIKAKLERRSKVGDVLESGESGFRLQRTERGSDVLELDGKKVLSLTGWISDAVLEMVGRQSAFEKVPSPYQSREFLGGMFYKSVKKPNERVQNDVDAVAQDMLKSFCHKTARRLMPAGYKSALNANKVNLTEFGLNLELKDKKFPTVVFVWQETLHIYSDGRPYKTYNHVHSFVVLGKNELDTEQFICFEKMGYNLPYRTIALNQIWRFWDRAIKSENYKLWFSFAEAKS